MSEIKNKLGKKIKYYRELRGLTQEELSEKIDFNCRSLSFIECGTNFVTADTLDRLVMVLNVTQSNYLILSIIPKIQMILKKN